MPSSFVDFVSVKARPRADFETQVGADDPSGRADVINRTALGLLANLKKLINTILAGGTFDFTDQDTIAAIANLGITPQSVSGTPAAHALYRENVAKVWASVSGTPALGDSFNVASVADGGTGVTTVTFDRDFANTDYAIGGMCTGDTSGVAIASFSGKAVGSVSIKQAVNGALADEAFDLHIFGDQ